MSWHARRVSSPVPPLVTMHLWRVPASGVPAALLRMGTDRLAVDRTPGVRFSRLLGTSRGFSPRGADPTRWGLLTVWARAADAQAFEQGPVVRHWARSASESFRADLRPVGSRGRWGGREPFGAPGRSVTTGPVASVTRARLRPLRTRRFRAAVPPVAAELVRAPGLLAALGVGERPVGLQGTFSLWRSEPHLEAFAYAGLPHRAVVRRTPREGWYAEELFARFAVLGTTGSLDGRDPLT
ncbi:MAG: putative spheroidene monooxygenase [Frankiales bacterium]|nr:putative spheroidene monooxygenase [Frankiales bacterium]